MSFSLESLGSEKRRHGANKQGQDQLSAQCNEGTYGRGGRERVQMGSSGKGWSQGMRVSNGGHGCKGPQGGPNQALAFTKVRNNSTIRQPRGKAKGEEVRHEGIEIR